MNKLKKILLIIFISLILFLIGNIIYPTIFNLTLPKIDGVNFTVGALNESFILIVQFGIILGLMPTLLLLVWNKASIESANRKLASLVIILSSMVLAIVLRYQMLIWNFKNIKSSIAEFPIPGVDNHIHFPIKNLHYEYYIFGGLIAGCLIAYFILRKKKEAFNTEIL